MPETDTPCPEVIHTPYESMEEAQTVAQARRNKGEKAVAVQCRTCGRYRVEKVTAP